MQKVAVRSVIKVLSPIQTKMWKCEFWIQQKHHEVFCPSHSSCTWHIEYNRSSDRIGHNCRASSNRTNHSALIYCMQLFGRFRDSCDSGRIFGGWSKLRFDFTHSKSLDSAEISKLNPWWMNKSPNSSCAMPSDGSQKALEAGAMALFGENMAIKFALFAWINFQRNFVVELMFKIHLIFASSKLSAKAVSVQAFEGSKLWPRIWLFNISKRILLKIRRHVSRLEWTKVGLSTLKQQKKWRLGLMIKIWNSTIGKRIKRLQRRPSERR